MRTVFPEKTVFSMDAEQSIDGAMLFFDYLSGSRKKGEFFFTGNFVREHPAECRKISEKHFTGAHGLAHEDFSQLGYSGQKKIVGDVQEIFSENKVPLLGWRFPFLKFNSASMRVLAEKKIPDFSMQEQKLRQWGSAIFFWNFLKCAIREKNLFLPVPFPRALVEHPFSAVDLFEKNPLNCNGRVILHCYNFENYFKT